jgi:hypothetical protein
MVAVEMEAFLKEQLDNFSLIGDLALINISRGDKAAASLCRSALSPHPVEKDTVPEPVAIEILARVAGRMERPTAPSPLYKNFSLYHVQARSRLPHRLVLRFSGSIPCSIRVGIHPRFLKLCQEKQP